MSDPRSDGADAPDAADDSIEGDWDERSSLRFELGPQDEGERFDVALSRHSGEPRSQVRRWIDAGLARLNGECVRSGRRVESGDIASATPPRAVEIEAQPEDIPLDILYSDQDLIVIDKAAGMVVHPAPGHPSGTLVNALLHHCDDLAGIGGALRPGIVHRLDRGTTGVMVAAKNELTHRSLAEQFHDHSIDRVYWAFVRALPRSDEGFVDAPIGRHPRDRKRMSVQSESGRQALTRWRVVERYPRSGVSRLEVRPESGRTHQIRVHLSSKGMPIVGDPVYGRSKKRPGRDALRSIPARPALHAAVLGLTHPGTGERLRFEAPLPEDLHALVHELEDRET